MKKPDYCTNNHVDACEDCSLVNYGRDCKNNPIEKKETRFTITVDQHLWEQVGRAAADQGISKRSFYEKALRDKLTPDWQEIPDSLGEIIEAGLPDTNILERNKHYLLAMVTKAGDGADAAAYCWRDGYPPEMVIGDMDYVRDKVVKEIKGWDESADDRKATAIQKLGQVFVQHLL